MTDDLLTFESPSPENLSELITGYEVNTLLSSSIRGSLYKARQISLDREVTIRVLPPAIGQNPTLRAAFESEAKTMARLNAHNLVDVFDFGDIDGMLFIIMERVPGRSLDAIIEGDHAVDQQEAVRLMADVCHGLHHAHEEGIVHRALNPRNILLNSDAEPKVVDFGLAKLISQQTTATNNPYAAPETLDPNIPVDRRADIYSAGMVLYDMIVGHLPEGLYAPPSSIAKCSPEIDAIIENAIQPDPNRRYASAQDMAQELESFLKKTGQPQTQQNMRTLVTGTGIPGSVRSISRPIVVPPPQSSNAPIIVVLLLVALMAVGGLFLIKNASQPQKDPVKKPPTTIKPSTPNTQFPKPSAKPPQKNPSKRLESFNKPTSTNQQNSLAKRHTSNHQGDLAKKPDQHKPITPLKTNSLKPPQTELRQIPQFEREKWLNQARLTMQKKAERNLIAYDKALLKNIESFERDVKRMIRRLDRGERKYAESEAEAAFKKLEETGRLPDEMPEDTPWAIIESFREAINDQKKIDIKFAEQFARLRVTYVQGIDLKIKQLKKEGNHEHAKALSEEIRATQADLNRFIRILRNEDPDPEPEEKFLDGF